MEDAAAARRRYLDLLSGCVARDLFPEMDPEADPVARAEGRDWPVAAETMIGRRRLDNLIEILTTILDGPIPGDLIETGVWRGGSTILMRGALAAWNDVDRTVWVADSFRGLPAPDADRYPADTGIDLSQVSALAVGRSEVEANFARYGLLDDQVAFIEGWFRDTLPGAPIDRLALLRLDGDLYESTAVALESLYPKVVPGGFVIVDDYGAFDACRQAVDDYRKTHDVTEPIHTIDWTGVWWRRDR